MSTGELPGWYLPPEGYLWDAWFQPVGQTIHVFHLFQRAPDGLSRDQVFPRHRPTIEHVTWSPAKGWRPQGTAIGYTVQPYDEQRVHTGCVVEHDGSYFMLYSGSNRYLCLATSDDLATWAKSAQNPVAAPDPALYLDRWRDPWALRTPVSDRYTVLVAAQQTRGGQGTVGVVAVAHSDDLVNWRQDLPLQVPGWFEWLEVPELHCIGGIWYLLFATRKKWVTPSGVDALAAHGLEPVDGAYYLMASSWRGPYETIGSLTRDIPFAYTTRLLSRSTTEFWLWSHVETNGEGHVIFGLRPPMLCTPVTGGGLLVK